MPPDLCPLAPNPRARNKVCVASGGTKYLSFAAIALSSGSLLPSIDSLLLNFDDPAALARADQPTREPSRTPRRDGKIGRIPDVPPNSAA
jgi:hypothetical protein